MAIDRMLAINLPFRDEVSLFSNYTMMIDHNEQNSDHLTPSQVIEQMIQLRTQLAQLSQQIQELEPSFSEACATLNTEKITLPQAIISRRLTPGQWLYSPDILTLEQEVKRLKQQFRQTHEPSSGREITWAIKLLPNDS